MLAARVSGVSQGALAKSQRKQSVASTSRRNSQEGKRGSSASRQLLPRNKAAMIREIETNWYLKMYGLGKDEMVATKTGMPYRETLSSGLMAFFWTCCLAMDLFHGVPAAAFNLDSSLVGFFLTVSF
ncbi:hypothetical protein NHX12_008046 [Muraenolepis orangiensis]|uniref:Uncharacterized protein n=1 Tax=Muraenolepis orangiensis TaxID=630683 RepID=A0A9Q0DKR3_9TELE|nr:hypothetical protein NHX12_008046 [Muraenolepis orangiensis]